MLLLPIKLPSPPPKPAQTFDSSDPLAPTDPIGAAGLGAATAAACPWWGQPALLSVLPCSSGCHQDGFPGAHRMSGLQTLALPARL